MTIFKNKFSLKTVLMKLQAVVEGAFPEGSARVGEESLALGVWAV